MKAEIYKDGYQSKAEKRRQVKLKKKLRKDDDYDPMRDLCILNM